MRPRSHTSARGRALPGSLIIDVAREAAAHGAVDLAFGVFDFPAPGFLKAAAVEAVGRDVNQYVSSDGLRALRDAIAAKMQRDRGVAVDPATEITVTCGATEAAFAVLLSTIDPGDEIIVFEPVYENYLSLATLVSARPRVVTLRPPGWRFDPAELAAAFNERTRAIVINTPNNPTGKVWSREELGLVAELCQRWDVLCVSDEIYEHYVYDGARHTSMLELPGMRERTVAVSALSKTYTATGWRVGWVVAPEEISAAVRKVHEAVTVTAPAPLQEAAIAALAAPPRFYEELAATHARRRDGLVALLEGLGFACHRPAGALYVMADFRAVTDRSDADFASFLVREIGVAAVPGVVFALDRRRSTGILRFCFGKSDETLAAAAERLARLPDALRRAGA